MFPSQLISALNRFFFFSHCHYSELVLCMHFLPTSLERCHLFNCYLASIAMALCSIIVKVHKHEKNKLFSFMHSLLFIQLCERACCHTAVSWFQACCCEVPYSRRCFADAHQTLQTCRKRDSDVRNSFFFFVFFAVLKVIPYDSRTESCLRKDFKVNMSASFPPPPLTHKCSQSE